MFYSIGPENDRLETGAVVITDAAVWHRLSAKEAVLWLRSGGFWRRGSLWLCVAW